MSDQKAPNKRPFAVEVEGKALPLAVVRPNHKVAQAATLVYNRAFREAVSPPDGKPGALVRQKVEDVLRSQNLWDDEKQAKYEKVVKSLLAGEKKLAEGGIKLSEAKAVAIKMTEDRAELRAMSAERNELDGMTAEAQAEQARFSYLVAACTVYGDTGKPYFKDVDDYLGREDDPVTNEAASNLGKLIYGLDDAYESKLPESSFLLKYKLAKLVDNRVRLTDKAGHLVDSKGRPVDDKGRLVSEPGGTQLVDLEGTPLTEGGDYKVEFKEFEDDVFSAAEAAPETISDKTPATVVEQEKVAA